MGIATTTSHSNVAALLGAALGGHWRDWFVQLVCGEDVQAKKPDPEVYRKSVELLQLPPGQVLALEDSPAGVQAARAAGVPVVVTRSVYFADADVTRRTGRRPRAAHPQRLVTGAAAHATRAGRWHRARRTRLLDGAAELIAYHPPMDLSQLQSSSRASAEWKYPPASPHRRAMSWWTRIPTTGCTGPNMAIRRASRCSTCMAGPGGACTPAMARFFDPQRYRVILFDQRGCGRSEPNVAREGPAIALTRNTTDHLVAGHRSAAPRACPSRGKMHVFGGSWGSMLALVYAIRHPAQVATLVLRGIFIGGRRDLHYLYQGNAATYAQDPTGLTEPGAYVAYPDEWKSYVTAIAPATGAT
jgi:hypothetical protein